MRQPHGKAWLLMDNAIFERRRRLLGNAVNDYLRKDQYLLFKDAFRASLETVER